MTDAQAELLAQISAATIDRMLADQRSRMRLRSRTRTRPGSLLKHQIPIRTFADWDDTAPGFVEIDLVAHDGCIATGECYLHAHHDRHRHRLDHQPASSPSRSRVSTPTMAASSSTINLEAYSQTARRPAKPLVRAHLRMTVNKPPCCVSSLMEAVILSVITASIKLEDATVPVPTTRLGWQPIAQLVPVGQRRERRQR